MAESTDQPHSPNTGETPTGNEDKAYKEVLANMKDQVQQATAILPASDAAEIQKKIVNAADTHYRESSSVNIVLAYQAIAAPLDKLITSLRELAVRAQREDVLKQPDLDEAPAAYRPAVSDYFESMSRDYHPDKADEDPQKP